MTTDGKDTASFFENGTTEQFEYCYKLYPQVLKLKAEKRCKKPQDLIRLDDWYQHELPKLIKARGKDAHMVYDELVQTMKWKQSRGKFYPQLSYLVKVNTPRAVMQETKKAFRKLPNLEQAITALSNLKGVGTTMASALLAAAAPDSAPFMADECLMAIPEIEGIDYTTKEYLNFVQHIQATVGRLNTQAGGETPLWSPHRVELALWAHYVANDLSPEMLDEMPGPGAGGGGVNTNGSAAKIKVVKGGLDGSEDTNDGDDESLGAVGQTETNNTATESETENENTNPTPLTVGGAGVLQDGDSNFVSNDSTSQEPIIDENTTQTTATNSTDDGERGTPLASDSESNMESPATVAAAPGGEAASAASSLAKNNSSTDAAMDGASNNATDGTVTVNNNNMNNNCNNNNSSSSSGSGSGSGSEKNVAPAATSVANANGTGNGNGTLLAVGGVSLDGDNSSSLRANAANDDEEEEDDGASEEDDDDDDDDDDTDEDRMADESSNSNHHKSVTPIIGSAHNTDNDSTLSSNAVVGANTAVAVGGGVPAIGQKRALHCANEVEDALNNSQPDMKKIRSD